MVKDHKILENNSIYDIANLTLGGFDNIYIGLILLNPVVTSIDIDLNTIATQNLKYNDLYYSKPTVQLQLNIPKSATTFEVKGLENQSVYDVALFNLGGFDNIINLIQKNQLVSINELDIGGKIIIFETSKVLNLALTSGVKTKGYSFGTLVKGENFVWDGEFIIWDGFNKLIY